jgi:hypothetical protein
MTVEIPLGRKYLEVTNGHHKSSSGNSGASGHRGLSGSAKKVATEQTVKGAKVLVLEGGRKRKFVPIDQVDDYILKALENLFEEPPRRRR